MPRPRALGRVAELRAVGLESLPRSSGGVTRRAVVAALLLLALLLPVSFYVSIVWNNQYFTSGVPASAQVTLLFLLAAAMVLPLFRRAGFTRRELLVIH